MFAKLFKTAVGQCLVTKEDGDRGGEFTYQVVIRCDVRSSIEGASCEATTTHSFEGGDEGEVDRDAFFDAFDQDAADGLVS